MGYGNFSIKEIEEIKRRKSKKCSTCNLEKNMSEYCKKTQSIDGREPQCAECNRKRQSAIRMARKININYA